MVPNRNVVTFLTVASVLCASPGCDRAEPPSLTKPTSLVIDSIEVGSNVREVEKYESQRSVENSILIGLDADMTSGAAQGGEAIRRGIVLGIDQINSTGGILGRPLELLVRDHRGNPERGIDNVRELAKCGDLLAVFGGVHTPVALRELELIHQNEILFLIPWAAGTPVVANGYSPNFVFRVSVRDEYAGDFLVGSAFERGFRRLGLLLERTGWGRSNETAMKAAIGERGRKPADVRWFNWGDQDFSGDIEALRKAGADVVVFVGNPTEGVRMVASMAGVPAGSRLPVISHWGITGGDFHRSTKEHLSKVDLTFLQTHSFIRPKYPVRSGRLYAAYVAKFAECKSERDVFSPVGTAHAYELTMMLATAARSAGSIERKLVRDEMERITSYSGVIRDYDRPFPPEHHDALTIDDFIMARFTNDGSIEPIVE